MRAVLEGRATVDALARRFGVPVSTVEAWRDAAFAAALEGSLAPPPDAAPAPPEPAPAPATDELCLAVIAGRSQGRVFALGAAPMRIGRAPTCEIVIDDDGVSRVHAVLTRTPAGLLYEADMSSSGSYVNGNRTTRRVLHADDVIHIGTGTSLKVAAAAERRADLERDPLTGALRREPFANRLRAAFATSLHTGSPLALALVNVDRFRTLNDVQGFQAGDDALTALARLLHDDSPPAATLCRFSGDGFVVLMPGLDLAAARAHCDGLRARVAAHAFVHEDAPFAVTVSVGLAALPDDAVASPKALVQRADERLDAAKRGGRNRTMP